MRIQKLSEKTLESAVKLLEMVFPYETDPRLWPTASVDSIAYHELFLEHGVDRLQYWVLCDKGQVIGMTGLYTYKDKDDAWLGWFCIDPEQRSRGLGSRLLKFSINKAKEWGATNLRLYTSDDPNEAAAQNLYERFGLRIFDKKKHDDDIYIYRVKELKQNRNKISSFT